MGMLNVNKSEWPEHGQAWLSTGWDELGLNPVWFNILIGLIKNPIKYTICVRKWKL